MSEYSLIVIEKVGAVTVIGFSPRCELIEDALLEPVGSQLLDAVRQADPPLVLLDLTATRFFGSGFIEVLLRTWRELQLRPNSRMVMASVQTYCREILAITHLDRLWPIADTRAEGLKLFEDNSSAS